MPTAEDTYAAREAFAKTLATKAIKRLSKEKVAQFPPAYRLLWQSLEYQTDPYSGSVARPDDAALASALTELGPDPWSNPTGQSLATQLFGAHVAPLLQPALVTVTRTPFHTGYNRRPYRCRDGAAYVDKLTQFYVNLLRAARIGLLDRPLPEIARFEGLAGFHNADIAPLYAAAMARGDAEGAALRQTIVDIVNGEAEGQHGGLTRNMIRGMLMSRSREDWEVIGRLLLAAQREEGLRQNILESLDECSLGAMPYFVELILAHDLVRFSSVVRAVDVWFGFGWEAPKAATIKRVLTQVLALFVDPSLAEALLAGDDNLDRHLALWFLATADVDAAVTRAQVLLKSESPVHRLSAAFFLRDSGRANAVARDYLDAHFGEHPEVDAYLANLLYGTTLPDGLFDRLLALAEGLPREGRTFTGTLFAWQTMKLDPEHLGSLLLSNATEPQLERLAGKVASLGLHTREQLFRQVFQGFYTYGSKYSQGAKAQSAEEIARLRQALAETPWRRDLAREGLSDRSASVQSTSTYVLTYLELDAAETAVATDLLRRKGKDTRELVLKMLLAQPDAPLQKAIAQLNESKSQPQRLACLELLAELQREGRLPEFVATQTQAYRTKHTEPGADELLLLGRLPADEGAQTHSGEAEAAEGVLAQAVEERPSLANGFGVIDYAGLTPLMQPKVRFGESPQGTDATAKGALGKLGSAVKGLLGGGKESSAASAKTDGFLFAKFVDAEKVRRAADDLYALFEKHAGYEYEGFQYQEHGHAVLLGNAFLTTRQITYETPDSEVYQYLPLVEVWDAWYARHGLNDFELLQLRHWGGNLDSKKDALPARRFFSRYVADLSGTRLGASDPDVPYKTGFPTHVLLNRLIEAKADVPMLHQFSVEVLEDALAQIAPDTYYAMLGWYQTEATVRELPVDYEKILERLPLLLPRGLHDEGVSTELQWEAWRLKLYMKVCTLTQNPRPVRAEQAILQQSAPTRNRADSLVNQAVTLFAADRITVDDLGLHFLIGDNFFELTQRQKVNDLVLAEAIQKAQTALAPLKRALLYTELGRGDLPTDATPYLQQLGDFEGVDAFVTAVERLGNSKLTKGYGYGYNNAASRTESLSYVLQHTHPAEDEDIGTFLNRVKSGAKQPGGKAIPKQRWLEVAMYAPGWAPWIAELVGVADLTSAVWWFHAHATDYRNVEKETIVARYTTATVEDLQRGEVDVAWWREVYDSVGAKVWRQLQDSASYVTQSNDHRRVKTFSGILTGETTLDEVLTKVDQKRDQISVVGLGLVPLDAKRRDADLLARYERLQRFLNERKAFGQQRQTSEAEAVETGLRNLARTAGYTDMTPFEWRMEGRAVRAMLAEPSLEVDGVTFELAVDETGKSHLTIRRGERELKSVPAKLRKAEAVLDIQARHKALREQLSRTRTSLERAMIAQTSFGESELRDMQAHPIVAALLAQLLLFDAEAETFGLWRDGSLLGAEGVQLSPKPDTRLVLAHPSQLFAAVQLDVWQRYAFERELRQPFKQIFRELYVLTPDERELGTRSERYQGHQVQPNKTVALLRGRGWTANYEEGLQHVDRARQTVATVFAEANWFTPADIESPVLEQVVFYDAKTWQPRRLEVVDAVLFSEVMRDLDLVVSVAHVGAVDPEASHSTMEMRAALVRESARLFKLDNVEVKERHVMIVGERGRYQVHLGSGMVTSRGVQLSIVAVQSQHRGRVFLPFVDDDPKSAEVVSKVLLLARDGEIRDVGVLGQL